MRAVSLLALVLIGGSSLAEEVDGFQYFYTPEPEMSSPQMPEIESEQPIPAWRDKWKFDSLDSEVECLAQNIYFEAWQEPHEGQLAVALVTINRVKSRHYPDSICKVVWQITKNRRGKKVAQFSWTLDGQADIPKNQSAWARSVDLAKAMLANASLDNYGDFISGATHYHATYVKPSWRKGMDRIGKIGLHIFYKP